MNITRPMRIEDPSKTLPVVDLYYAVQAEGSRAGRPTVVVRTTGCTHRCFFGSGGWCDSWYTSIHPEKGVFSLNDIKWMYDRRPDITEMMLTGGSPTMHPELLNELSYFAADRGIFITLETEGSHFVKTDFPLALLSISPKFSNTVPVLGTLTPRGEVVDERFIRQHNKFRVNEEAIRQMIDYHANYQIKPVVNPIEQPEIWDEIAEFLLRLEIPKRKVWIMPPGDSREELIRVYPLVMRWCTDNGYNFTGRPHVIAFDKARYV